MRSTYGFNWLDQLILSEDALLDRVQHLTDLCGQASVGDMAVMCRARPLLLQLDDAELAVRLLGLRRLMPRVSLGPLLAARPSLLFKPECDALGGVAAKLDKLMPGVPWQEKLTSEDSGSLWWSFQETLANEVAEMRRRQQPPDAGGE